MFQKISIIFFLFFCLLEAKIVEIRHIEEILPYVDGQSIVVFDIDNVLMEPKQELGNDQWFTCHLQRYKQQGLSAENALKKALSDWHKIQAVTEVQTVETKIVEIVQKLRKKKIPMMGLTFRDFFLAARTVELLQSVGIDLSKTAPCHEEIFFKNGRNLLFHEGIVFTGGANKGESLKCFFDNIDFPCKKILYIDDKLFYVEQLEKMCKESNIEYTGFRYGFLDEKIKNFHPRISDIQFQQFKQFGRILSDQEAASHLDQ